MDKPKNRSECKDGIRPCPFVSCRYHLYLEVHADGDIHLNHPNLEIWDMKESCALDVADDHQVKTFDLVGECLNVSKQRVDQICRINIFPKLVKRMKFLEDHNIS